MTIARRVADSAVLRDNRALAEYLDDVQDLLFTLALELPAIARASKRRLRTAPARSQLMSQQEKGKAADYACKRMVLGAKVLGYASRQLAGAVGTMQAVFVPNTTGRNRKRRSGGGQQVA